MGRFINADSYASTGQGVLGNNMFTYCLNSPTNGSDPQVAASFDAYKRIVKKYPHENLKRFGGGIFS